MKCYCNSLTLFFMVISWPIFFFINRLLIIVQLLENVHIQYYVKALNVPFRFMVFGLFMLLCTTTSWSATGVWESKATGSNINYTSTEAYTPVRDYTGNYVTIVYLENLGFSKIGRNSNATDVDWLLSQGYRVIELNYANNVNAISPAINTDIIAINDAIAAGSFCGFNNCSKYKSYILFEGYRILRNVPYFKDDPAVYNTPAQYTIGDSLYMDIIYPANASVTVPAILSFSYSNSYATYDSDKGMLTDVNKDQRLNLGYTLAGFNDSFLEGAPANGIAWAIADHPKYCPWGGGKPLNGSNDTYKSYETNPDAAQKVKSAIRTLRVTGNGLGLSGKIGIFGFSRGSDAGSMAIGDRNDTVIDNAGFNIGISDDVQAAALGPGVFDFTQIYNTLGDGDINLETRCPWVWGPLTNNYDLWHSMGSAYFVQTSATAPVLFFYNTDDSHYYQDQIAHFKAKLDSLGVPTETLINYGTGHAVPQTSTSLAKLYNFFNKYLAPPSLITGNDDLVQLCMVTVDMETGKNILVWEQKNGYHIKTYRIYRKTTESNIYDLLDSVSCNEISLFIDSTSTPEQQQYLYKISVVDSFNNESAMGKYHKPIFLKFNGSQNGINLSWNTYEVENNLFNFNSYVIYKGSDSTKLQVTDTLSASGNEYTDLDPTALKSRMFYRVAGIMTEACTPSNIYNSASELFVQSISNLVDNNPDTTNDIHKSANQNKIPLFLFPNPVADEVLIKFSLTKAGKAQILLCNLSGIVLYQTEKQYNHVGLQSESIKLDQLMLPQSIYYVKVITEEMQGITKFIKGKG